MVQPVLKADYEVGGCRLPSKGYSLSSANQVTLNVVVEMTMEAELVRWLNDPVQARASRLALERVPAMR
jgi:hypothetical protein